MPRRMDAPIGRPAQEQPLATPKRTTATEYQSQTQQWEERGTRWQEQSSGKWESREQQDRSRSSRQWEEGHRWTEQSRHDYGRQDWSSHQGWISRSSYGDGGFQHQWQRQQQQEWNQPTQDQQWTQSIRGSWQESHNNNNNSRKQHNNGLLPSNNSKDGRIKPPIHKDNSCGHCRHQYFRPKCNLLTSLHQDWDCLILPRPCKA